MEMHGSAMLQRFGGGQKLQAAIELAHRAEDTGRGQDVAALEIRRFDSRKIQRRALSRGGACGLRTVYFHAAHAYTAG